MKVTTEPVMIAGYGNWEMEDGPATRGDGSEVKAVTFVDVDQGQARKVSLDQSVNESDMPEIGSMAGLVMNVEQAQKGGRDGIVRTKDKWTVLAFETAQASNGRASRAASAAASA